MKPKKYFIVLSMAALLFPLMTHAKFSPSEKKDIENAREWIEAERVIFSDSKKNKKNMEACHRSCNKAKKLTTVQCQRYCECRKKSPKGSCNGS